MSTSSDFVDTPFDENLPELPEVEAKYRTIPETSVVENINYAYMRSSIEDVLCDNGNGNMNAPGATTTETIGAPPIMLTQSPDANKNISATTAVLDTTQIQFTG
ncbi:hypothetical protein GWK47_025188 [Chionoecetes opilio]|uniref:Uncharacterized protein n=1 Tax=Chionoecetes opilio TaxID=41210 RepID=A0A8J4XL01_CHIOP|nr:hypothetical protein GWK47_025188 [Chionoecetes opilio]